MEAFKKIKTFSYRHYKYNDALFHHPEIPATGRAMAAAVVVSVPRSLEAATVVIVVVFLFNNLTTLNRDRLSHNG
ncbi:hypothetical protein OSB04_023259 [Centaurea solstitialis]|uniref:Uncharacterized protein n=1 Tax=Centaurea solstitialis TaxID=347529 RepID=A0AA38T2B8_9ASTR|nr:hypothetical protein OSB04_023259 [Centaurea solstitialis]